MGGVSKRRKRERQARTDEFVRELRAIFIQPRSDSLISDEALAELRDNEEDLFSTVRNQQEVLCPNGSCRMYACPYHRESGRVDRAEHHWQAKADEELG